MSEVTSDSVQTGVPEGQQDAVTNAVMSAPPATGHRLIDEALTALTDLDGVPVGEQHERLAAAHEVMAQVLEASRDGVQASLPGMAGIPGPRPR